MCREREGNSARRCRRPIGLGACHDGHGHGGHLKKKGGGRGLAKGNDQWVQGCLGISAWVQERVELDPQSMH